MTNNTFYLQMLLKSLYLRLSRLVVAILAIAIGATVLFGMLTLYYDIPAQLAREMRSYGANMILSPQKEKMPIDAISEVLDAIPEDKLLGAAPFRYEALQMNRQPITAVGTDFDEVKQTRPYWHINGEWPTADENILVGIDLVEHAQLEVGQIVQISGKNKAGQKFKLPLKIVGILKTGGIEDSSVFMDITVLNGLLDTDDAIEIVELSVAASSEELVQLEHKLQNKSQDIVPQIVKRITRSESVVLEKLQALVYLVTIVMLFLTLICVGATMMAIVMERSQEIGLKKAIGAENRNIIIEFLGESLTLGFLGSLLGIMLGWFFAQEVSWRVFGRSVSFDLLLAIVAVLISMVITGLACILPIRRATLVDPAIVLRGE